MPRRYTAQDYARRIQRVAAHIATHLDSPLPLAELAAVANFSEFHFHRIYRELMGETVGETVRRERLHRAASELLRNEAPIAMVARRAGYASTAAFTRALAAAYGVPPATYRAGPTGPQRKPTDPHQEVHMYDVTFRDFPRTRLVALRHTGPYDKIGGTFQQVFAWAGPRGIAGPASRCIGVYYDDPDTVPAAQLRSDACLTLPEGHAVDGDMRVLTLKPAHCAVVRHKGPYAELPRAYRWLFRTWLPSSGFVPADQPSFEEYVNDPMALPPSAWLTDVFVPLRRD
jgi:AraC family transcriptional regulator